MVSFNGFKGVKCFRCNHCVVLCFSTHSCSFLDVDAEVRYADFSRPETHGDAIVMKCNGVNHRSQTRQNQIHDLVYILLPALAGEIEEGTSIIGAKLVEGRRGLLLTWPSSPLWFRMMDSVKRALKNAPGAYHRLIMQEWSLQASQMSKGERAKKKLLIWFDDELTNEVYDPSLKGTDQVKARIIPHISYRGGDLRQKQTLSAVYFKLAIEKSIRSNNTEDDSQDLAQELKKLRLTDASRRHHRVDPRMKKHHRKPKTNGSDGGGRQSKHRSAARHGSGNSARKGSNKKKGGVPSVGSSSSKKNKKKKHSYYQSPAADYSQNRGFATPSSSSSQSYSTTPESLMSTGSSIRRGLDLSAVQEEGSQSSSSERRNTYSSGSGSFDSQVSGMDGFSSSFEAGSLE